MKGIIKKVILIIIVFGLGVFMAGQVGGEEWRMELANLNLWQPAARQNDEISQVEEAKSTQAPDKVTINYREDWYKTLQNLPELADTSQAAILANPVDSSAYSPAIQAMFDKVYQSWQQEDNWQHPDKYDTRMTYNHTFVLEDLYPDMSELDRQGLHELRLLIYNYESLQRQAHRDDLSTSLDPYLTDMSLKEEWLALYESARDFIKVNSYKYQSYQKLEGASGYSLFASYYYIADDNYKETIDLPSKSILIGFHLNQAIGQANARDHYAYDTSSDKHYRVTLLDRAIVEETDEIFDFDGFYNQANSSASSEQSGESDTNLLNSVERMATENWGDLLYNLGNNGRAYDSGDLEALISDYRQADIHPMLVAMYEKLRADLQSHGLSSGILMSAHDTYSHTFLLESQADLSLADQQALNNLREICYWIVVDSQDSQSATELRSDWVATYQASQDMQLNQSDAYNQAVATIANVIGHAPETFYYDRRAQDEDDLHFIFGTRRPLPIGDTPPYSYSYNIDTGYVGSYSMMSRTYGDLGDAYLFSWQETYGIPLEESGGQTEQETYYYENFFVDDDALDGTWGNILFNHLPRSLEEINFSTSAWYSYKPAARADRHPGVDALLDALFNVQIYENYDNESIGKIYSHSFILPDLVDLSNADYRDLNFLRSMAYVGSVYQRNQESGFKGEEQIIDEWQQAYQEAVSYISDGGPVLGGVQLVEGISGYSPYAYLYRPNYTDEGYVRMDVVYTSKNIPGGSPVYVYDPETGRLGMQHLGESDPDFDMSFDTWSFSETYGVSLY